MGESFEVDNYYVSIPGVRDTDAMIAVTGTNGCYRDQWIGCWIHCFLLVCQFRARPRRVECRGG